MLIFVLEFLWPPISVNMFKFPKKKQFLKRPFSRFVTQLPHRLIGAELWAGQRRLTTTSHRTKCPSSLMGKFSFLEYSLKCLFWILRMVNFEDVFSGRFDMYMSKLCFFECPWFSGSCLKDVWYITCGVGFELNTVLTYVANKQLPKSCDWRSYIPSQN